MGKTTLAAEFPNTVFLQVEDGTPANMELDSFGVLTSYSQVMEAITALYTEEHSFRNVAIDSLDKLEPPIWAATCEANKWDSIETPGYGKGYLAADVFWRDLLEGLNALRRDKGMSYTLIAHSDIGRFDDPRTASYSRFDIRLHKRALAIIEDEMDLICFLNQDATIKEEKQGFGKTRARAEGVMRYLYVEGRPSMNAKNRYGMPSRFPYQLGNGYAQLAAYFPHLNGGVAPVEPEAEAEPVQELPKNGKTRKAA